MTSATLSTTGSEKRPEPPIFTAADKKLIYLLIDVQSGKIGILTALKRVKELRP